jgi:hypothetical protein
VRRRMLIGSTVLAFTMPVSAQSVTSYIGDGNDILLVCTAAESRLWLKLPWSTEQLRLHLRQLVAH